MSKRDNVQELVYKFLKVDEYFADLKNWQTLDKLCEHRTEDNNQTLVLKFQKSDSTFCEMLLQFVHNDTFRLRFNPDKLRDKYSDYNSKAVQTDTFDELKGEFQQDDEFYIDCVGELGKRVEMVTKDVVTKDGRTDVPIMRVVVTYDPFKIEVFNCDPNGVFKVWETAEPGILYTPNGNEDYAIIQAVKKPATAKYIGFGEQGGKSLYHNTAQLNFFNYDNMRYRQVYDRGPLEPREPLYHSAPFFIEFNGNPEKNCVTGIHIDNRSQVLIDIGYSNSSRYMLGTRFGDLDYYFFMANEPAELINAFTAIVGRSTLKPRYALGYHQGCYGYEERGDLEWVVRKHRDYQIPLDGLHVDVDIQQNYHTFTIDDRPWKFPDPKGMFDYLKGQGVKCSTNITPIISREEPYYTTYTEGLDKGYFVLDRRHDPDNANGKRYQDYGAGNAYYIEFNDPDGNFNSGQPYIGEVYYGNDAVGNELHTTGHYPDLARQEVRDWWGRQYQYLFDMGLEMVWQDMTTPAIRPTRGDMRGFPFRLLVNDDSTTGTPQLTPAIKAWNAYSYNLHEATYEGLNNLRGRENTRNFIIGRGSFAGAHRYAGLWTGDNSSSWDFLKINVAQVLSTGMTGVTICGEDIGGFEKENDWEQWASPELLIRWVAAGAFLPWFRNHYIRKGRKQFQEVFMYKEWFAQYRGGQLPEPQDLYLMVLPICKYYIELRYQLLQVFYDAMFENTFNGLPICRPMILNDPQDKALYNDKIAFLDDQFFVRQDLLIAPVLDPQSEQNGYGKRDVYLPAGSNWYCFMNNKQPLAPALEGGTTVRDVDAHLSGDIHHIPFIVPIYVRSGAIVPTVEIEQYVGELNRKNQPNPITLNIYPGASGQYSMYLDDGVSRSSAPKDAITKKSDIMANSEYRETLITHSKTGATSQIAVKRVHDGYTPKEEYFFVAILHDSSEPTGSSGPLKSVSIDGQEVGLIAAGSPDERAHALKDSPSNAWYYNENINISFVKVFDRSPSIAIQAEYSA